MNQLLLTHLLDERGEHYEWTVLTSGGVTYSGTAHVVGSHFLAITGKHSVSAVPQVVYINSEHIVALF